MSLPPYLADDGGQALQRPLAECMRSTSLSMAALKDDVDRTVTAECHSGMNTVSDLRYAQSRPGPEFGFTRSAEEKTLTCVMVGR